MASANETALARNLLNSVLALAFPENLVTDATAQQQFLAQLPQIKKILLQQNVFGLVHDGKALEKFQTKLFHVIDQPPSVLDKHVRAAAFELQLVVVHQCAMEQLETLTPKLIERIIKVVKYQQDGSNPVLAPALNVAAVVVRNIEVLTPEVRRELYDSFSKFLPAVLSQLQTLGNKSERTPSDVQLWKSGIQVFTELLEASPNALRIYATKIEQVCVLMFQCADDNALTGEESVYAVGARCLGLLSNASDKTHQLWKQIVERTIEMANLQVDLLSGKRSASQMTAMKGWVKDNASDALLSVYQRAELVLARLRLAEAVLAETMTNRAISEREVQLVMNDIIALARRALSVRATEIGKQSAVSEDGFRLPSSVVYGILPRVQELSLRILAATVQRAGICALRHASKIIKVLRLASENASHDSHDALYFTIGVCVRSLGASTVEKLGVPLLEEMVARCKSDLDTSRNATQSDDEANQGPSSVALAEKKGGKSSSKGKKRKRQTDVSQLSEAATTLPFVSRHNQLLLARNVDAALASIATCVSVYGSILPMATRSAASEIALFAVQERAKQRFSTSTSGAAGALGVDAVALLLLADAVSADATGAHATNLTSGLHYWRAHARHSALQSSSGASSDVSTILQFVALNAGETLLHPRAPPLSINFQDAATKDSKQTQQQRLLSGYTSSAVRGGASASSNNGTASGVRGKMDWDDNKDNADNDAEEADEEEESRSESPAKQSDSPKKQKVVGNEEEDDVKAVDVSEEEDEEDDFEDERPAQAADKEEDADDDEESKAVPRTTNDDDDDDEFPDIVVDDEDDE